MSGLAGPLAARLAARGGPTLVTLEHGDLVRRRFSRRRGGPAVARLSDGTSLDLWIKEVNHPDPLLIPRLDALRARAPARVPRAWVLVDRWLVMDRVPGVRLLPRFFQAILEGDATALATRIGAWLGAFHAATVRPGPALADLPLDAPPTWRPGSHREGVAAVPGPSPWVELHNDFTLRNMLLGPDGVEVIDWDNLVHPGFPPQGPAWHDAAVFLVNLWSWRRARPLVRPCALEAAGDAFVASWLGALPPGPHAAGLWHARARLDLGLVERPLSEIYRGFGGRAFVEWHRADLARGPRPVPSGSRRT